MSNKSHKITSRSDFTKASQEGKKFFASNFIIIRSQNKYCINRYGLTVTKKIGKANVRNKIKRRLRVIMSQDLNIESYKQNCETSYDYVIIARKEIQDLPFQDLRRQVEKGLLYLNANKKQ